MTAARTTVHFVRTSDTLQSIALSYGLSVEDFCKMNDLKPGANSLAGKTLVKVPDTSGPSKPAIEGARLNLKPKRHSMSSHNLRVISGSMQNVLGELADDATASMEEFRTVDAKSQLEENPSFGDDFQGWFKSVTGRDPVSESVVVWKCFTCAQFYKSLRESKRRCSHCGSVMCAPCAKSMMSDVPKEWVHAGAQLRLDDCRKGSGSLVSLCGKCMPKLVVDRRMRQKAAATSV